MARKYASSAENLHGDHKSDTSSAKIPAKAGYFDSVTASIVCEDWMVETVWTELPAPHADIEPVSGLESGTEFFNAETDR